MIVITYHRICRVSIARQVLWGLWSAFSVSSNTAASEQCTKRGDQDHDMSQLELLKNTVTRKADQESSIIILQNLNHLETRRTLNRTPDTITVCQAPAEKCQRIALHKVEF